jgi:hypothetical protein
MWTLVATSGGKLVRMEQSGFRPDQGAIIRARTTVGRSSSVAWNELSPGCDNVGHRKGDMTRKAKVVTGVPPILAFNIGSRGVAQLAHVQAKR